MVARHEMPETVASRNRPVGYGMIGWRARPIILEGGQGLGATDHTVPYGMEHVCRFPRHFMPGHHHLVPTGQRDLCPHVGADRNPPDSELTPAKPVPGVHGDPGVLGVVMGVHGVLGVRSMLTPVAAVSRLARSRSSSS